MRITFTNGLDVAGATATKSNGATRGLHQAVPEIVGTGIVAGAEETISIAFF